MDRIQRIWFSRRCGACGRKMYKYARRVVDEVTDHLRCVDQKECSRLGTIRYKRDRALDTEYEVRRQARNARAIQEELDIRETRGDGNSTKRTQEYAIMRQLGDEKCRRLTSPDSASLLDRMISAFVRWLERKEGRTEK